MQFLPSTWDLYGAGGDINDPRDAIIAGIRRGRSWIAESAAVDLTFAANAASGASAGIAERLWVPDDAPVTLTATVRGAPGAALRLITDQGQRTTAALDATGAGTLTWPTTPRNSRYARIEVRRPDSMVALTNPIFLGTLS